MDIFYDGFTQILNRHALFRRYRVKGRDNPWFPPKLTEFIHARNVAWAKARATGYATDWTIFRQLRNKCSSLIKKAKSEYYLSVTTKNLNDPRKFWKAIKSFSVSNHSLTVPNFVMKDFLAIHDKMEILNCFNEHFAATGSLFASACSASVKPSTDASVCVGQSFNFVPKRTRPEKTFRT